MAGNQFYEIGDSSDGGGSVHAKNQPMTIKTRQFGSANRPNNPTKGLLIVPYVEDVCQIFSPLTHLDETYLYPLRCKALPKYNTTIFP
ncbi:hypothetical protein Pan97_18880 [Bremerella volcania]|uniref:Uncharacterized protein n=1 Tax=Bremerella volcania TaxID=2527984 RepID=A0A518C6M7_9BACT|nr:hypothetical protein Pan97_18880 [Bremerella volcania]